MKQNKEIIDIITILDDYDFIVDYIDTSKGLIRFMNKDRNMFFTSTFKDVKNREFVSWLDK